MENSLVQFAHIALFMAWLGALAGIIFGAVAAVKTSPALTELSKRILQVVCLCSLLALCGLGYAFLSNDYTNQYVWAHSNRSMDAIYKITAIWGGMDGSMLFWAAILSCSVAIAVSQKISLPTKTVACLYAVLASSEFFFLTVVTWLTNPFRVINAEFIPPDGNGLNPLLQNAYMAIHPPMLYLGFTTFTIPFAYCLAALLSGEVSNTWIRLTRRWTLIAWAFLTTGIVLGGHWAYLELGWGGFWAWDPVENASFLPWLTATAYLHSVMIQERKNMLKIWNVWLVILTYGLTVLGTFLTRSGVVQSVHAFAETNIGWVFLLYLGILLTLSLYLTILRRKELAAERHIESLFSREAAFLLNNLVFLAICFATLWGVLFPVFSEQLTGEKQTLSIPFFNAVNVPLFLLLIFLMGVGPLIAWRKANLANLKKTFLRPFIFAALLAPLLLWAGVHSYQATLAYCLCWFVTLTLISEVYRAYRAQKAADASNALERTGKLITRHYVRYGGYLVHFGIVIMAIGITASMAHKVEKDFLLKPGQNYQIGRFNILLKTVDEAEMSNYTALTAEVELQDRAGEKISDLRPELRHYNSNQENTSEVAIRMSLREDFYLVLAGLDESGEQAAFKVFINPLQVWLWIGTVVVLVGTGIAMLPGRSSSGSKL